MQGQSPLIASTCEAKRLAFTLALGQHIAQSLFHEVNIAALHGFKGHLQPNMLVLLTVAWFSKS
jgi:hypothetical protein